jgi:hypothetical protein
VVAPLPTAGSWSNKLGIGLSDRSVVQENARGKPSTKTTKKATGLTGKIRAKKEKMVGRPATLPSCACTQISVDGSINHHRRPNPSSGA